jgi:hypothetical protein
MKVSIINSISKWWDSKNRKSGVWTQHTLFTQVAMAKLDLNKTHVFLTVAKVYMMGGGVLPQGNGGCTPTLGRIEIRQPIWPNKVAQHPGRENSVNDLSIADAS